MEEKAEIREQNNVVYVALTSIFSLGRIPCFHYRSAPFFTFEMLIKQKVKCNTVTVILFVATCMNHFNFKDHTKRNSFVKKGNVYIFSLHLFFLYSFFFLLNSRRYFVDALVI